MKREKKTPAPIPVEPNPAEIQPFQVGITETQIVQTSSGPLLDQYLAAIICGRLASGRMTTIDAVWIDQCIEDAKRVVARRMGGVR